MELQTIRNGSIDKLRNKEYTLSIGISLGNKWFTVENTIELIKWCLSYTKDKVVVYVGDSIHAINLEVKKRISLDKALDMTHKMGDELLNQVKADASKLFSSEELSKLHFAKWNDLVDDSYNSKIEYLNNLYKTDHNFKDTLESIARKSVENGERTYSEEDINRLGVYIVEELPHQINKVQIGGIICDALVYPFDGEIPVLVEEIQKGGRFPEIKRSILDTEPKVFLEVR